MAAIEAVEIDDSEVDKILSLDEDHFNDLKSRAIAPGKLTKTMAALANAEGGEIFIGIEEDKPTKTRTWAGFPDIEAANGHLQTFEDIFPLGDEFQYSFLYNRNLPGYVLKAEIHKSLSVRRGSDGNVYLRRGAQNLPVDNTEALVRLERNKGLVSYETETVGVVDAEIITDSATTSGFIRDVVPNVDARVWMKKQMLLVGDRPTVAGTVLFADEPQAVLPKRCGIKVYRYKTSASTGTRETLDEQPRSVEGPVIDQINHAVASTIEIIESVRVKGTNGLESVRYPKDALHEVITNAVLHRDYSIADDIHIRIFDNRVEVVSPGTLPGHITPSNILEERFSRNGVVVRLINKFPDPPNKDVGEGLNTAFDAMRQMKLKTPEITVKGGTVVVVLRHEPIASPEEIILEFLGKNPKITNREARGVCFIGSENNMKRVFQGMMKQGIIELVPGTSRYTAAYRLVVQPKTDAQDTPDAQDEPRAVPEN